ncbi:MAG: group 1 truncated hemoglobin [Planctomycetes bacterium]|nr:group 1 truncated hemoglobin [Planctomycetota bacterium]
MKQTTLYERLGGYDGIAGFVDSFFSRVQADQQIGRFWQHRGDDGLIREKRITVDYLSLAMGGPVHYTDRDLRTTHKGMGISASDWSVFLGHAAQTMEALGLPQQEYQEVYALLGNLEGDIVEE